MKKILLLSLTSLVSVGFYADAHYGQPQDYYYQGSDNSSQSGYYQDNYNNPNRSQNFNQSQGYYYNQNNPNQQNPNFNRGGAPTSDYYYNQRGQSNFDNRSQSNYDNHAPSNFDNRSQSYFSSETKDQTYSEKNYPQDSYSSETDRQINGKIREKITGWVTDSYKNIALNTNNGVVTISGNVKSNDDLTKLTNEVRKIEGVRSVNNNVQIHQ